MDIQGLRNTNIYLAPYNDVTINFSDFLQKNLNTTVLNFLDKEKKNASTLSYNESTINNADFIIIMSPNYFNQITKELLRNNISKEKILYVNISIDKKSYKIFIYKILYLIQVKIKNIYRLFQKYFNISYLKICFLKNKHKHKRAFIIGNGPSLREEDLMMLKNEITFSANKIYLAFETIDWRPSYYFVVDKLVFSQNYQKIKELKVQKLFSIDMIELAPKIDNAVYFNLVEKDSVHKIPTFHANPIKGIHKGDTVVYAMTEFAVYMGITELYFIGMDFNFIVNQDSSQCDTRQTVCNGEINHFHKDYRKVGEKWNKPNMPGLQKSFFKIREYCEENNIKVYNATRGGKLEILDRIDLDSLFQK